MNKDIMRYRRMLKRNLHCGRGKRQQLLKEFSNSLSCFMDEYPDPTYSQLADAFGPPEEMASVMMERVSKDEEKQYQRGHKLLKYLKIAAIVLLAIFAIYTFFEKEYTIIEIYDELMPVGAIVVMGGE